MSSNNQPKQPKHADPAKSDAQERADVLNSLPTYQPRTPASDATALPAPVQHVENGDWGGVEE